MNACLGGAIPIYYGELDEMDQRIFNKNRIIFVNPGNLMNLYNTVKDLISDPLKLTEFYKQEVFMRGAYEVMTVEMHNNMRGMMDEIRARIR